MASWHEWKSAATVPPAASKRDARPPSQFPTYNFPHVIAHRISTSLVTSGDAPRHKLEIKRNQGGESCCRFERLRF